MQRKRPCVSHLQEHSTSFQIAVSTIAQVSCDLAVGHALLVDLDHLRDSAFVDVERGEVGKEVVARKEAEKHKVVYDLRNILCWENGSRERQFLPVKTRRSRKSYMTCKRSCARLRVHAGDTDCQFTCRRSPSSY